MQINKKDAPDFVSFKNLSPLRDSTFLNQNQGRQPKVFIKTFGCQMNDRDSEFVAGLFIEKGYRLTDSPEEADVILFNTCSVREHAEERAINNMALLMNKHKNRTYGMVGCMAQALKEKLFARLPNLDLICGTGEIARLPELVETAKQKKISALADIDKPRPDSNYSYRESATHAYVSIMEGCDNFCSYCVVPYVRGRERSRRVENIVNEIKDLARKGIKEIMLLGQNVNSYKGVGSTHFPFPDCLGKPLLSNPERENAWNFVSLLKVVNSIPGIEKINFLTSHPKDADIELFIAMRDLDRISKHLHLPIQSGSDRILKLMNRSYTREEYLNLVRKAREIIPNLRITTDVIVGFPTEEDNDHARTLDLMKEVKFDFAYIFKYSPRPGTKAAEFKDDVPLSVKKTRHAELLKLVKGLFKEKK